MSKYPDLWSDPHTQAFGDIDECVNGQPEMAFLLISQLNINEKNNVLKKICNKITVTRLSCMDDLYWRYLPFDLGVVSNTLLSTPQ